MAKRNPIHARFPFNGFPFKNVSMLPHSPGAPALFWPLPSFPALPPPSSTSTSPPSSHRSGRNTSASSPHTSLLLFIACIGTVTISPRRTRIASHAHPCLSTNGRATGTTSSRPATRIVDVTGACSRSASRTTASRYGCASTAATVSESASGIVLAVEGAGEDGEDGGEGGGGTSRNSRRSRACISGARARAYSVHVSAAADVSCPAERNVEIWQSVSSSESRCEGTEARLDRTSTLKMSRPAVACTAGVDLSCGGAAAATACSFVASACRCSMSDIPMCRIVSRASRSAVPALRCTNDGTMIK